ncbi:MAG: patatin-like phospholipase family protein [Rikenellaceae bacterium]
MKRSLIFLLILMLTITSSTAQQAELTPSKGGVGLVLSGGGAKGLYHVGVLRALEENDIPIDYVSGASMGAIVSSLYASGWSPERMWDFFVTDSVSTWLTGKIPEQYSDYYRRFERTPQMVNIDIISDTTTQKSFFNIPTNLISPDLIDLAFLKLLGPASATCQGDFNNLFVPFRCVASNVYDKELVTFRDGYLPFAVRASMTIPLVFTPLSSESTLLYDGGVLNNFPYQVLVEDFTPSNLIGVACTDNYDNPQTGDLAAQIMTLATVQTDYNLPDSTTDIRIRRVMPEFGLLEYNKADSIMQKGYDDAMAQMEHIKGTVTARRTRGEVDSLRREFNSTIPELTFDSIIITGITPAQERYVRAQLGLKRVDVFTFEYFHDKYLKMLAAGVFKSDFPTLSYDPTTGYYQIHLKLSTKGSMSFSLGGNISSSTLNQAYAAFNYKHTSSTFSTYSVEGFLGMTYDALKLSGRHDLYGNFPYYINYNATYEYMNYSGNNMNAYYKNKDWRMQSKETAALGVTFSHSIFNSSAFKTSVDLGSSRYKYYETLHTSADSPSQSDFAYLSISPQIETSSINYPMYPNEGVRQTFSMRYVVGASNYRPGTNSDSPLQDNINKWWAEIKYYREHYIPLLKWFNLGYLVDFTISNHPGFSNDLMTSITAPRFAPTPQMQTLFMTEFTAQSYLAGGVTPVFNFLDNKKLYLKTYAYIFVPQTIFTDGDTFYAPTMELFNTWVKFAFGGSLVYQTPIGPASVTVAKYSTGPKNWNYEFNFGYTLFRNLDL